MKHLICGYGFKRLFSLVLSTSMLALLSGCEEANIALDHVLGRTSPVLSASAQGSAVTIIQAKRTVPGEKQVPEIQTGPATSPTPTPAPAKRSAPGEKPSPETEVKPSGEPTTPPAPPKAAQVPTGPAEGKKRDPGQMAPAAEKPPTGPVETKSARDLFAGRDPFRQPTEVLPTDCPPSMPLCRFDPAQLKLVGVIQVEEGNFKGLVEDPDGRGYFITSGMQIGRATVTQINAEGVTLHDHRTRKDVPMRLLREGREGREL
ncbi:MAG: hypothetical protein HY913_22325 [Desulfomonile tiedjei]|nr:hypothetical protein [Desulfomonile tiedjei]